MDTLLFLLTALFLFLSAFVSFSLKRQKKAQKISAQSYVKRALKESKPVQHAWPASPSKVPFFDSLAGTLRAYFGTSLKLEAQSLLSPHDIKNMPRPERLQKAVRNWILIQNEIHN